MTFPLVLRRPAGPQDYMATWEAMRSLTDRRGLETPDELWLLQHPPVFTLGQAGRQTHCLSLGDIPLVRTDRGGQVTYHGPGQLIAYVLLDMRRAGLGVKRLVGLMEQSVIDLLAAQGVAATTRAGAPGVYVDGAKIASLGLRVRNGCSYHGLALNCAMDLSPFGRIDPCGYPGLAVTQLADLIKVPGLDAIGDSLVDALIARLGVGPVGSVITTLPEW